MFCEQDGQRAYVPFNPNSDARGANEASHYDKNPFANGLMKGTFDAATLLGWLATILYSSTTVGDSASRYTMCSFFDAAVQVSVADRPDLLKQLGRSISGVPQVFKFCQLHLHQCPGISTSWEPTPSYYQHVIRHKCKWQSSPDLVFAQVAKYPQHGICFHLIYASPRGTGGPRKGFLVGPTFCPVGILQRTLTL